MNYIENWFHFYATTESFEVHRKQGLINPDSICFLRETGQIYTQNSFFGICRERYEKLEQLVLEHDAKIKDILGVEGPSVRDGIINNIADLVNFLDGFTDEDNLKDFLDAMKQSVLAIIKNLSDDLRNELDGIHQDIRGINSQIDTIDIRLDGHDTAISSINTTISSHLREYTLLKNSYDAFKQYSEAKFTAIDNSIKSLDTSINTLQREFTDLDEKFDDVENEVSEVKAYLEDAKKLVKELEDRFGEALADMEQFKRDLNAEIDDFKSSVGKPDGIAPLDSNGQVPAAFLPSYVDDVLEYATKGAFPLVGESGKIYVALDDNLTYRWSGSTYVEISKSLGLGETASTAYPGNKGKKNAEDITRHIADQTNPHNVTKAQLGLDKVDNVADVDKPISKATQNALDDKVDKVTGKGLSTNDFTNDLKFKLETSLSIRRMPSEDIDEITEKIVGELIYNTTENKYVYWDGAKWKEVADYDVVKAHIDDKNNPHEVTKAQVGLGNVDNTSDADKPISTAQQEAFTAGAEALTAHTSNKNNPHEVTKTQVGLGNVDNTSDANKPVSTAQQTALDGKVDKVTGKGLSTNDYTTDEKNKLAGVAANANNYSLPTAASGTKGGVKVGSRLSMSGETLSADEQIKWRTIE